MAERIEVGYTPAEFVGGAGIYHKYILYTNANGDQFYSRGGPELRTEFPPSPLPFGDIITESGKYERSTPDWDPARDPINPDPNATPHPREKIAEGDDLSREWQTITERMREIENAQIPYDPKDSNSNASVDEALREAGLPTPRASALESHFS